MGSEMNFTGFGNEQLGGGRQPAGNFSLVRQPSVYSLTFDEFQSTVGKEFGSMNMDELLKSIWSAEETQNMASTGATIGANVSGGCGGENAVSQGGYLQRQGSLTLPRTMSQKTVDEVWKDMAKEYGGGSGASVPQAQRQPTLGEITLEEFLVRAGVVREDNQISAKPDGGFLGDIAQPNNNNTGFGISFQQMSHGGGLMGSRVADSNAQMLLQPPNLPLNVNGVRSSQYQPTTIQYQPITSQYQPTTPPIPQQQRPQPHQQPVFPKQDVVSYVHSMAKPSRSQLASPGIRDGIVELANPTINGNFADGSALHGGGMGMLGLGGAGMGAAAESPASLSSNGMKSNGDTSSVSPVPYMFNGGLRGRKSNSAMEKVIERRQRRMIKNRESAARSRQRKQAYTLDLEEEVAKLKEENDELRKKQEKMVEMQKNQELEMRNAHYMAKRRCLKRTLTGPW